MQQFVSFPVLANWDMCLQTVKIVLDSDFPETVAQLKCVAIRREMENRGEKEEDEDVGD